jgi:hypothetical protein
MGNINAIERFYHHYADLTNNGVVLNLDLSVREDLGPRVEEWGAIVLTAVEVEERKEWRNRKLDQIASYYDDRKFPIVKSREDFMRLRVIAPCLDPDPPSLSARSPPSDFRANQH